MSSETAVQISKEAKGIHQGLKELLKTRTPWDREVEFNRKTLRRLYLRLLLLEPYAKASKDAETHLWMQTSYQFISRYKQDIATLDRALQQQQQERSSRQNRHSHQQQNQQQNQRQHGPVEYRKLVQRFRQFLAEEEKFWIAFVARYHRQFGISEAQQALKELAVTPATPNVGLPELGDPTENGPAEPDGSNTAADVNNASDGNANGNARPPRDHFGFPPEDSIIPPLPPGLDQGEQRGARLAILVKALVCLGDITRYRELYNESGGRPKAGQEDGPGVGPARRGRRRNGGGNGLDQVARARTYHRSIAFYEQARTLLPSDGNAAHQLAILSFYSSDVFGALYWYWRALCVRGPYEAAVENVRKVLGRATGEGAVRWAKGNVRGREVPVRIRIDRMKEDIVLLYGLLRPGAERQVPFPLLLFLAVYALASHVAEDFKVLVSERSLPIDMVTRVVVLAQGAVWKHRMIRDAPTSSKSVERGGRSHSRPKSASGNGIDEELIHDSDDADTPVIIEYRLLTHLLTLHRVLLEIGIAQLATPLPSDVSENDLAQRITATFRRMLPALRVASKWLLGNARYVFKVFSSTSCAGDHRGSDSGREHKEGEAICDGISRFYTHFAQFYTALGSVFPISKLPRLEAPLDEDVDLRGFLPLKGRMIGDEVIGRGRHTTTGDEVGKGGEESKAIATLEKVHPNEEQLMRIWDLLTDAEALAEIEGFPVDSQGPRFVFHDTRTTEATKKGSPAVAKVTVSPDAGLSPKILGERGQEWTPREQQYIQHHTPMMASELDDDAMTDTGRTDDDPVRDAFRQVLANDASSEDEGIGDDEDADKIVWNPRPLVSPPKACLPDTLIAPKTEAPVTGTLTRPIEFPSKQPATNIIPSAPHWTIPLSNPKPPSATAGTTAQDLLNNVMGFGAQKSGSGLGLGIASPRPASGMVSAQPTLLFGSGSQNTPVSIWSTTLDQDHQTAYHHAPAQPSIGSIAHDVENRVGVFGDYVATLVWWFAEQ
ncbi:hypothetical protein ID866_5373 [Astraeus odoratus]|nr:hypothetical protein ID866_5373 [Astraeus odoratus]